MRITRSYDEGRAYAYEECAEYMDILGYDYIAKLFRSRIPKGLEKDDNRPSLCRNRQRDEGKYYPKSGCNHCGNGGLVGCPYEKGAI